MGYYEPPPQKPPSALAELFVITRAVFGVLFWPLAALAGIITALALIVALFSLHWALGLLALIAIAAAIGTFAWWERQRIRKTYP